MADSVLSLSRLSEPEREQFRVAVNFLFTEGFLIRAIDQHERSYRFVLSNLDVVEGYLEYAGWSLRREETLGIIALTGPASARLRLRKEESIVVLILRLLYEEKAGEIELHGERTVRRHEIQDRYRALSGAVIKKTPFITMLRRFQALRLVRIVGDESDPDATVVLYPSLAFVLDGQSIDELENRLAEYTAATDREDEVEETEDSDGEGE